MDHLLGIEEMQTNNAMKFVGVPAEVEIKAIDFLAPGYDFAASEDALYFLANSCRIEKRRNEEQADLVVLIAGRSIQLLGGSVILGIALTNSPYSATSLLGLRYGYTFTHEVSRLNLPRSSHHRRRPHPFADWSQLWS